MIRMTRPNTACTGLAGRGVKIVIRVRMSAANMPNATAYRWVVDRED